MSIWAKQQICLHLKQLRCLSSHPSGQYALRFHIYYKINNKHYFAIPVSVMQTSQSSQNQQQGNEIGEKSYTTKSFVMKPLQSISLNEVCIFKSQVNIFTYEPDYNDLSMNFYCEILRRDFSSKQSVASVFQGKLFGASSNDFLEIDFYDTSACQVTGSIHSCIYQYEYISKNPKYNTFQKYCDAHPPQYVQQLLRFLLKEGKYNLTRLKKLLKQYGPKEEKKEKQQDVKILKVEEEEKVQKNLFMSIKAQSKLIKDLQNPVKIEKDLQTRPTQEITDIQEQKLQNIKKKRKRIFGNKQQIPINNKNNKVTIQQFQKILHENAQSIYQRWRELIKILTSEQSEKVIQNLSTEYRKKILKLLGQSVVRFKGSWDIDLYAKEQIQRNKMAYQARTLISEDSKETNEFYFYNSTYFSQYKPIIFQEFVPSLEPEKNQTIINPKAFIILVHGLGACRLDMEKLKIQLKRYYHNRVQIMISIANQGRTQGDIDTMGVRLASEIQHQLAKFEKFPPITFIGHSMGGLIIRSALPRLSKHSKQFHSFISFSSPHLGFAYSNSKLVDAGLWFMNSWKKCQSILQLTMQDEEKPKNCFLYKLSQAKGLEWFQKLIFLSSHQDLYVPYYSARIQKPQECLNDCKNKVEKGILHNEMINNLLNQIKGTIVRTDVNFSIPEQNLDNLIGRAAHISFVQNTEMLRLFSLTGEKLLF